MDWTNNEPYAFAHAILSLSNPPKLMAGVGILTMRKSIDGFDLDVIDRLPVV